MPRPGEERNWKEWTKDTLMNGITVIVCVYILFLADVVGVMARSKKIYRPVLYTSFGFYAVFFAIWFYLAAIVSRWNPKWENTHMNYIFVATGSVTVAGVLWVVALWPVFHIWTLPLGFVGLWLFLSLLSFLPGSKSKSE